MSESPAVDRRAKLPCFNMRDSGHCTRQNCPYSHDPAASAWGRGKGKGKDKGVGKGKDGGQTAGGQPGLDAQSCCMLLAALNKLADKMEMFGTPESRTDHQGAGGSSGAVVAWTCSSCATPHTNARCPKCRGCGLARTASPAPPGVGSRRAPTPVPTPRAVSGSATPVGAGPAPPPLATPGVVIVEVGEGVPSEGAVAVVDADKPAHDEHAAQRAALEASVASLKAAGCCPASWAAAETALAALPPRPPPVPPDPRSLVRRLGHKLKRAQDKVDKATSSVTEAQSALAQAHEALKLASERHAASLVELEDLRAQEQAVLASVKAAGAAQAAQAPPLEDGAASPAGGRHDLLRNTVRQLQGRPGLHGGGGTPPHGVQAGVGMGELQRVGCRAQALPDGVDLEGGRLLADRAAAPASLLALPAGVATGDGTHAGGGEAAARTPPGEILQSRSLRTAIFLVAHSPADGSKARGRCRPDGGGLRHRRAWILRAGRQLGASPGWWGRGLLGGRGAPTFLVFLAFLCALSVQPPSGFC